MDELTPSQIELLETLLEELVKLPPSQRATRLAELKEGALRGSKNGTVAVLLEYALDEPASFRDFATGEQFGDCTLLKLLGKGGFGEVWLARQTDAGDRDVALKMIHPRNLGGSTAQFFRDRFQKETNRLIELYHPAVVTIHKAGFHPLPGSAIEAPYFVMEHIHGKPITLACRGNSVEQKIECFIKVGASRSWR